MTRLSRRNFLKLSGAAALGLALTHLDLQLLDLHDGDVFWCTADPGWVTGMSYGILAPLLHGVTLGATGKSRGDRHPKVRRGAMLGAGAQILGNIEIGAMSRIGAGSVTRPALLRASDRR